MEGGAGMRESEKRRYEGDREVGTLMDSERNKDKNRA